MSLNIWAWDRFLELDRTLGMDRIYHTVVTARKFQGVLLRQVVSPSRTRFLEEVFERARLVV